MAIGAVNLAELLRFLPESQTMVQAIILAMVTGFFGGGARWLWDCFKRFLTRKLKL